MRQLGLDIRKTKIVLRRERIDFNELVLIIDFN